MAQDEQVQRLGIVSIAFYVLDEYQVGFDFELHRKSIKIICGALPIRHVANYILFQDGTWKQVFDMWNLLLAPFLRLRTRSICGECIVCFWSVRLCSALNSVVQEVG